MQPFTTLDGLVAPLDRANVDTDAIIPKQFLKSIRRTGFGRYLFDEWRYLDQGQPDMDVTNRPLNPDFVLNQPRYRGAEILLTQSNFGCGSSREHAPWALLDYGFKCIVAKGFADIFYGNCFKNGILPVVLPPKVVDDLFRAVYAREGYRLTVDLPQQTITTPDGERIPFEVDPFRKDCLVQGLDDIGLTLKHADEIRAYEARRREQAQGGARTQTPQGPGAPPSAVPQRRARAESRSSRGPATKAPKLPSDLPSVPISIGTRPSTPKCSAVPRPCSPSTPVPWLSSSMSQAPCLSQTSSSSGSGARSPSIE